MSRRDIIVDEGSGWSAATFGIIALVIIAAVIALFVWQPWNSTHTSTTTTVTQPGSNANGTTGGTTGGSSGGSSSSSSTTTTGGH